MAAPRVVEDVLTKTAEQSSGSVAGLVPKRVLA